MGYYTRFTLKIEGAENPQEIISQLRAENDHANYALDEDGDTNEETKWYDSVSELAEFSKKHPSALFTLEGEGEESGDFWRVYAKNGKTQRTTAEIVFKPFDESKLE